MVRPGLTLYTTSIPKKRREFNRYGESSRHKNRMAFAGPDGGVFVWFAGPELAERVAAWREKNGPFEAVEDLMKVSGIGEKKLEGLRDRVTVSGGG